MTDKIDLDELDVDDDEDPTEAPNRGDWFWRGEGDPEAEPADEDAWASAGLGKSVGGGTTAGGEKDDVESRAENGVGRGAGDRGGSDGTGDDIDGEGADDDADDAADHQPAPRVPRQSDGAPVGIPVQQGGAGSGQGDATSSSQGQEGTEQTSRGAAGEDTDRQESTASTGPGSAAHDAEVDADDMTLAFTYGAISRLADPRAAVADAEGWTDWIGIVGDVEAHVINKFQRDHRVDVDFFSGAGTGAAERLASIGETSMFYADRMVVVGREDADEPVAEAAGWEFVPLREAAGEAGWDVEE